MKSHTQPAPWTHRVWSADNIAVERNVPARRETATIPSARVPEVYQPKASGGLTMSMQIVGILAFCQAILFLVLFLFLCARAGAATTNKPTPPLELTLSTYTTQTARDPFGAEIPKAGDGASVAALDVGASSFTLGGILYDAVNPAALVNDQLVELNKPVKVRTGQGKWKSRR